LRLGRLEIFLSILVIASLGWFAMGINKGKHGDMCTPLPLSQEVKAYIDSKFTASAGGQCGEVPALVAKLADLETKLGGIDTYRMAITEREARRLELVTQSDNLRDKSAELLKKERESEIAKLKAQIGGICAAGGAGPGAGAGAGAGGGAGGFGGRFNQQEPQPSIPGVEEPKSGAPSDAK
jgi:hypothetical protein